jgi:lysophospholipase L1-like esterase
MKNSQLPAETTFSIDFNLHWVPAALGLDVPPAAAAEMMDISEPEFLAYVAQAEAQVNRSAKILLGKSELAEAVDRLAIPAGGTMMAIGDSITTYRYGYARLLAAMLELRRPNDKIQFLNVAQSGYTSTHGLENSYTQFLTRQPDWVLIKFGVNDGKRFGGPQAKTLVSLEAYRANMTAMVEAFLEHSSARPVLLTPAPVIEDVVNNNPDFQAMRMTWSEADIKARAASLHDIAQQHRLPLVDLVELFGDFPDPELYLPDGLHPGPAGHELILEALLRTLSA